ncbi:MAG TPA: amino acid permease [Terriglobales bacterium]|nr:amino acid permease [Terriglobales bacterium]
MSTSRTAAPATASDGLVRALGPWESLAMVVGTLIGTGIFFVSKDMVNALHSIGWILLAWLVGAFLSLAGALAYAEMGTLRPQAGGEYAYLRDGLGPLFGFLFGWGMFWIVRPASVATIGAGFALAASFLWPGLSQPVIAGWPALSGLHLVGAGVIALVTLINYLGVRHGGHVQALFTGLKLLLVAGLTIAAFAWGNGSWAHFSEQIPGAVGIGGFATALVAALWAYDGWNDLTLAGSEIRDPGRTIPRAMIGGIAVVFLFYAGINLAYFYVLRPVEIAASNNVASSMAARFLGHSAGALVAVAIMISAFATLNSSILSGARVPFAMAHDRLFFRKLAHVHPVHRTPDVSLLIQALFAMGFSLSGTYQTLYTLTIFAEWLFYMLAIACLFVFRRRGERAPYASWGYPVLPGIFIVAAAALLGMTYWQNLEYSSIGLAIILAGVPAYFYFARRKRLATA